MIRSGNRKKGKEHKPEKDILTPHGNASWEKHNDDNNIAEDIYKSPSVPGSAGVEC